MYSFQNKIRWYSWYAVKSDCQLIHVRFFKIIFKCSFFFKGKSNLLLYLTMPIPHRPMVYVENLFRQIKGENQFNTRWTLLIKSYSIRTWPGSEPALSLIQSSSPKPLARPRALSTRVWRIIITSSYFDNSNFDVALLFLSRLLLGSMEWWRTA